MDKKILISWIGHTDLNAMKPSLSKRDQEKLVTEIGKDVTVRGPGPIKTLLSQKEFNHVHLISTYQRETSQRFKKWLGTKCIIHQQKLPDPSNHSQILSGVQPILEKLNLREHDELFFHLSPGTPQMAAIWILLAKSKFPATLFQTHDDQVTIAEIPFDVTVEVIPKLLEQPDRFWEHLASEGPQEVIGFSDIVGDSPAIRVATGRAKRAAIFDVTVLITGESGTGKELFGSAIHNASHRRNKPLVTINCAAISRELLESELFGHVKGAFTGADKNRAGAFEQADGGTLFLDEVGECDLSMQAKILRALQPPPSCGPCTRVFRRVGATEDTVADVRVVAATNRDLRKEIQCGNFRDDLFYRLSTITLKLPPLRERKEDIELLAESLLEQINTRFHAKDRPGYRPKSLTKETMRYLRNHHWPGNVRELYNALVQAAVMQDSAKLSPQDIAAAISSTADASKFNAMDRMLGDGFDLRDHLDQIRRHYLLRAMQQAGGVKTKAADLLGFNHDQTFAAQLEKFGIQSDKH